MPEYGGITGIIPARWLVEPNPTKVEVCIVYNWMDVEVPRSKPMPMVDRLSGWRRREVIFFVSAIDWTTRMYE